MFSCELDELLRKGMDSSRACPAEDTIHALMDHLVSPLLPLKPTPVSDIPPSLSHSVAHQMSAVVLLYNYYHRKEHPELEFLGFESFCRLSVVLKPALIAHMKVTTTYSIDSKTDITEIQLSALEKAIMSTCNICQTLDASVVRPNTEGWPVSKVSVFLVDSKRDNCLLYFGSVTQGVWSMVEKEVDYRSNGTFGAVETKYVNKRKRIIKKAPRAESFLDEFAHQHLAFSAVKEATGIFQNDLSILENHIVYSRNKEKTTTCFYIMKCTNPTNDNIIQVPIEDVIHSLEGPLVTNGSCGCTINPVVEYFHLLPCSDILRCWFAKVDLPQSMETLIPENGNMGKNLFQPGCGPETKRDGGTALKGGVQSAKMSIGGDDEIHSHKILAVDFNNSTIIPAPGPKKHDMLTFFTPSPDPPDAEDHSLPGHASCPEKLISRPLELDMINPVSDQGRKNLVAVPSSREDEPFTGSGSGEKSPPAFTRKANLLSQVALDVLLRKKDKLCQQRRAIEEEIELCDKTIRAVITGGEGELMLKLESIIEFCSAQLLPGNN